MSAPVVHRWQHRVGAGVRFALLVLVASVPFWLWPAYLSGLRGLLDGGGTPLGGDFVNFWSAASLAVDGRAGAVVDVTAFPIEQQRLVGEQFAAYAWFYPPHLLLLVCPLGLVGYVSAWVLWSAAGFAAFAFASRYAAKRFGFDLSGVAFAGLLLAPAATINLISG